jgi:hypothetical protein
MMEVEVKLRAFLTAALDETDQLRALAAAPPVKKPPLLISCEARWTPEL